uniref:O-fucosyltransferase family protein n=1 Tax=Ananas comosus var. bracteatus TaxID=296719 RepID=A0A6V7QYH1_ANACO
MASKQKLATVWKHSYKGGGWRPCTNMSTIGLPESNGYIYVEANGGLNQQRTSICNAVAVAGYLNATLVIPNFHYHSIWRDPSKFSDIYDKDHFIETLTNDVRVVDTVPEFIMERFGDNMSNVFNFKIKAWSSIQYYKDAVLPKLAYKDLSFANRLSFDAPPAVQRLRCLANFEALRFSNPIATLAEKLVSRMKEQSVDNNGKYVAVHLRFEEDMVAFSCCIFDGGEAEKQDMNAARERGWRGKFTKPGRVIRPGAIRMNGKCPLTPLEVGLMLRGMGFGNNTVIYLASGKIYKAEKTMIPLLEMFPLLQTKESLASPDELAPFKNFSSRMAAIDYSVCLHSEVFVTTQGGNFPHFLIGHRRYLYGGHSKTIKPDKRKLAVLFANPNIGWKALKRQLLNMRAHSDAKGIEIKRPNDSIYTFPCPDCMCRSNKTELSGFNRLLSSSSVASELAGRSSLTLLAVPDPFLVRSEAELAARSSADLADVLRYHVLLEFLSPSDLRRLPPPAVSSPPSSRPPAAPPPTSAPSTSPPSTPTPTPTPTPPPSSSAPGALLPRQLQRHRPGPRRLPPYDVSVFAVDALLVPYGFDLAASETRPPVGVNITRVLVDARGFNVAASMLEASGVAAEFEGDEGGAGITVFSLPAQEKAVVLRFHVLHSYYPLGSLESIVNPVQPTLATEDTGAGRFTLNITRVNGSVAIDTGIVQASITRTVFDQNPVAVFAVSRVLLPREIFGGGGNARRGGGPGRGRGGAAAGGAGWDGAGARGSGNVAAEAEGGDEVGSSGERRGGGGGGGGGGRRRGFASFCIALVVYLLLVCDPSLLSSSASSW